MTIGLRRLFIVVWLSVQILLPLFRKFEFFPFRYRLATFSWAIYARPPLLYQARFFKADAAGGKQEIPELERFILHHGSAEQVHASLYFPSEEALQGFYARLVRHIADSRKDGCSYGVSIRWVRKFRLQLPAEWEYKTVSHERAS